MKLVLQNAPNFILRFDKGEEIFEGLGKFMKEQDIKACVFNAIGACSEADLGYFNEFIKDYRKKPFVEDMEIVSLNGNAGLKDGEPSVHAHGMFGRTDFSIIGGHVFKLVVSVTAEVFVTKLDGALERQNNPDFNLSLLV